MIQFTQAAQDRVVEICKRDDGTYRFLRMGVMGGGCSGFRYAMQHLNTWDSSDNDYCFPANGLGLIIVDQMSMMYLDGTVVDYEVGLEKSGFTFKNPAVKTTCGCGQSFSI